MASDRDTQASYRDALACMLTTDPFESPRYREFAAADRVIAAGWRPPARVITDPAELDALPTGAVVLDHARPRDAYTKRAHGYGWYGTGSSLSATSSEVLRWGEDRVTVLYVPTEEAGQPGGATLQCGRCGAVTHAPASPDGRVPIQPLTGWTVIPHEHIVRCPSCATEEAGRG